MLIRKRRGWEPPASAATPEHLFRQRRRLIQGLAAGPILLAGAGLGLRAAAAQDADPTAGLDPVARNPRYQLDPRIPELSDEKLVTTYNNFYEFGSHKQIWQAAQELQVRPWTVTIDGMVEQEQTLGIDDLLGQMPLEERVYRHRCVEAWSMAVPWSGFPMRALVDLARPLGSAKYVRMETFQDPDTAPRPAAVLVPVALCRGADHGRGDQRARVPRDRPVRQADAARRTARRCGWPCRGSTASNRSSRSSASPSPTSARKASGNRSRRASTASGRTSTRGAASALEPGLGDAARHRREVPTLLYNGYGEFVADLYKGLESERLFM